MKKLPLHLLAFALSLSLFSCGGDAGQQAKIDNLEKEVARLAAAQNSQASILASNNPAPQVMTEGDGEADGPPDDDDDYYAQEGDQDPNEEGYTPPNTAYWDYPETSSRLLTDSELKNIDFYQLRIMRNEIFARYGYIFKSPELQVHFAQKRAYQARYSDVVSSLTATEKKNIEKIKKYEKLNISSPR
jgi:hypothetical protein